MPKPVRVDAEAEAEIAAAIDWYEGERAGLGAELLAAIGDAVRSLAEPGPECTPARGVSPKLGVRRKLVGRFPYAIVFVELPASIRVIAVAHGHRRPGYWRRRI